MSKIQIAELQARESQINSLSVNQASEVVGGDYGSFTNKILNKVNIANVVQLNIPVNVQVSLGGDNYASFNLGNNANTNQG